MDKELVGYLLNALDADAKRDVERRLADSPELEGRLERLRQALAPLAADREPPPPPPELVSRTIAAVAEHMCRPLPKAPVPMVESLGGDRPWWRRVDVLLAACLLIAVIGMGGPFLVHSQRSRVQTVQCQENLRVMFPALEKYHDTNRRYPHVREEKPRDVAGMVVPILYKNGALKTDKPIVCPSVTFKPTGLTLDDLRKMELTDFVARAPELNPGYAYHLGFRDETGAYHPPVRTPGFTSVTPLMADAPLCDGSGGNSLNHAGYGQNVLYQDGHVKFAKSRLVGVGGDDIFWNKAKRVAAGLDPADTVLGCSSAKPSGE